MICYENVNNILFDIVITENLAVSTTQNKKFRKANVFISFENITFSIFLMGVGKGRLPQIHPREKNVWFLVVLKRYE